MCEKLFLLFVFLGNLKLNTCDVQIGPDPWDYENINPIENEDDIPTDLKTVSHKKIEVKSVGVDEYFYRRLLSIVLKGGEIKRNEDGSIDISLQMQYNQERWSTLEGYIISNSAFTGDMYRRSMGYVEEAIIKKSTITKIVTIAWSEYIQFFLIEYKMHIMWATSISAVVITMFWLWKHIYSKHLITFAVIGLYLYEVIISYKEAEKEELSRFLSAINTCKWYFWKSSCEVPPPDPIKFMKHMNPLKIGIRMFSTVLTEPMITLSETIQIIIHGVTDGLWYPLDKIMYGFLVLVLNSLLIFLLVLVFLNYILNIPFSLNFLGIFVGIKQRSRSSFREPSRVSGTDNGDRLSGENLSKLLDVYNRALHTVQSARLPVTGPQTNLAIKPRSNMRRSASTGRLSSLCNNNNEYCENSKKDVNKFEFNGGGDAC